MTRIVVCVPTYNEASNLEPLVRELGAALAGERKRVLVIDDGSPDGTGAIAARLADKLPWVSLLERGERRGLGTAYVDGFRWALDDEADLVVTMDCDFSHDPRDVPRLVRASAGADLVVGSRFVRGGSSAGRTPFRRLVSRSGSLYAQGVLGASVKDFTAGFKCFRRVAVEALDLECRHLRGYGFHIEATYRVLRAGLRVDEIPIRFVDRRAGVSKLSGSIVAEAAFRVPTLRARALAHRL